MANCFILQPKIELFKLSFSGTVFSHAKRNSHIQIKYDVGKGDNLFVEATNMPDNWEHPQSCGDVKGSFVEETILIGEAGIKFTLVNETGIPNEECAYTIPFWEILADGVHYNGGVRNPVKIYADGTNHQKTSPAILWFRFTGLPTLK